MSNQFEKDSHQKSAAEQDDKATQWGRKKVKPNFFVAGTHVLNTLRQGLTQNVKCRKTHGIMSVLDHNMRVKSTAIMTADWHQLISSDVKC